MKSFLVLILFYAQFSYCQELKHFEMSSCDKNSFPEFMHPFRLVDKKMKGEFLELNLSLVRGCAFQPRLQFEYRNDTLIIEVNDTSENSTACDCYFGLTCILDGIADTNFVLVEQFIRQDMENDSLAESVSFAEVISNSNKYIFPSLEEINTESTVNQYDENGLKIGVWNSYYENKHKIKNRRKYKVNELGRSILIWSVEYSETGKIVSLNVLTKNRYDDDFINHSIDFEQYLKLKF